VQRFSIRIRTLSTLCAADSVVQIRDQSPYALPQWLADKSASRNIGAPAVADNPHQIGILFAVWQPSNIPPPIKVGYRAWNCGLFVNPI
jgi:hypothetical protein